MNAKLIAHKKRREKYCTQAKQNRTPSDLIKFDVIRLRGGFGELWYNKWTATCNIFFFLFILNIFIVLIVRALPPDYLCIEKCALCVLHGHAVCVCVDALWSKLIENI